MLRAVRLAIRAIEALGHAPQHCPQIDFPLTEPAHGRNPPPVETINETTEIVLGQLQQREDVDGLDVWIKGRERRFDRALDRHHLHLDTDLASADLNSGQLRSESLREGAHRPICPGVGTG